MTDYLISGEKEKCYGCGACEKACPKNAISLYSDSEGFLYPCLDKELCIECGRCKAVCPYDNSPRKQEPRAVYAAQNANEQRLLKSSSGGMFFVFAEAVLSKGGAVAGCVFDENLKAVHIVTEDMAAVEAMQGSKYVQSDLQNVFVQIKERLERGQQLLFTGTPCQVDGLKCFLGKQYSNLLTIDIICHGVPSPLLLKEYIASLESKKGKVSQLKFRNKARNGWRSEGTVTFENGKTKSFSPYRDSYYNLYYLRNCASRMSCYECKYASPKRVGDITIGDFWNASDFLDEAVYKGGISVVLVNTSKGEEAFEAVSDRINMYESDIKTAQKGNARLVGGTSVPNARFVFYKKITENGYDNTASQECKYSYVVPFIKKHIPKSLKKIMKQFLG